MKTETRLFTLDAMRGIAALVVVFFHLAETKPFATNGYLAVDFFFMLSGFVIARTYEPNLVGGKLSAGSFIVARLLRLYPLYAVGLMLGAGVGAMGILLHTNGAPSLSMLVNGVLFGAAFLPTPGSDNLMPLNIPAWSLSLELLINVAFCFLLAKWSTRALILVVIGSGLLLLGGAVVLGDVDWGATAGSVTGGLVRVTFGFTVGVLIWRLGLAGRSRPTWAMILPCAALVAGLMTWPGGEAPGLLVAAFVIVGMPLLIVLGARWQAPTGLKRISQALGDMSYPIYVIHVPLVAVKQQALKMGFSPTLVVPVFVVGLCLTAWVLGTQIDPHLRRWLKALFARSAPPPAPVRPPAAD